MSIEIKQKTVDIVFELNKRKGLKEQWKRWRENELCEKWRLWEMRQLRGQVDTGDLKMKWDKASEVEKEAMSKHVKALRLHFSLMGETSPQLSPLAADFAMDGKTTFYRYDWVVGATLFDPYYSWSWFNKIAKERAMVVQLLVDSDATGCGVSESSAFLLGLLPSKDTVSLFEKNQHKLGGSLDKLADLAGNVPGVAGGAATLALKTSAVVSNFVVSQEGGFKKWVGMGQKNWFLYRFLDERRKCCSVEWNISRNVLHQYGSALRGSILLAFHGSPKPEKPLKLLLRPRLNFGHGAMNYDPPEDQLEDKDKKPVELEIKPLSAQS